MQRLARIRAAIQRKILQQYPELSADAIEPYCRLLCRKALDFMTKDTETLEADPQVRRDQAIMGVSLAAEADELRDALEEVIERVAPDADDDEHDVRPLVRDVMETFINGGLGTPPLPLDAIRARVDTGSYLISRWSDRDEDLPAYAYWQHRVMVWMLALGCDAPGMIDPLNPEHPEEKAEFCAYIFPVEIAALKRLIAQAAKRVIKRDASDERNMRRGRAALDELQRQFVGEQPEPPADWLARPWAVRARRRPWPACQRWARRISS
jgi:hypothetical protein